MKDHISIVLVFAMALMGGSEPWVLWVIVLAIALLQYDKIEALLNRSNDG